MANERGKSVLSTVATVLVAIVLIWIVLKAVGVVFKLIGLLLLAGLGVAAYLAVTKRIGGPRG